jgi:hypothetical protein
MINIKFIRLVRKSESVDKVNPIFISYFLYSYSHFRVTVGLKMYWCVEYFQVQGVLGDARL